MAGEAESSNSIALVRSWRTAFLTIRDETQSHPTNTLISVLPLVDELVFAHYHSFVAAASSLPPQEVSSDLMYLLNLAASSHCTNEDTERALSLICHLVYNISLRVPLALSTSAWSEMLGSFSKIGKRFIENVFRKRYFSENSIGIKATKDCLETVRLLINVDSRRNSISENIQLVEFLLHIVVCCHFDLNGSYHSNGDLSCGGDSGKRFPQHGSLLKVQTTAFSMIGEAFTRVGASFPVDTWQSVVEVLRKVMDALGTKMFPTEDGVLSRFYSSVLHCLHLVLINRKASLSDHLAAFVAALRIFLAYGLNNSSLLSYHSDKDPGSSSLRFNSRETIKKDVGAYKPPHLRRKTSSSLQQAPTQTSQKLSDQDSSPLECSSSDSDYSDSDGVVKDFDNVRSCKARVAAINCIQVLCEADPKAFIAQWAMLLPTNDVLHRRKYEATLMSCLLFDPFLKVRLASASAIAAMLEEPSSVALQVAEYRESTKLGSYTALSSALGQILMQIHAGVLYLIQHEKHTGLLTSLFKILMLLISSTPSFGSGGDGAVVGQSFLEFSAIAPYLKLVKSDMVKEIKKKYLLLEPSNSTYLSVESEYSRMPGELLPRVLSALKLRIKEGFRFKNDQTSLLAIAISCLTAAVSALPSSSHVIEMFEAEISAGLILDNGESGVLITLVQHAEHVSNPTICLEALQALKALCHNYPNIMAPCWKQISATVYQILRRENYGLPYGKGALGHDIGSAMEKVVSAAVKVLDECLRAVSGFRGTEDLFGDRIMETPFVSDFVRDKKISSAPSHVLETGGGFRGRLSGSTEWSEAIEKHIAISICHVSGMVAILFLGIGIGFPAFPIFLDVRAASITCFAGITCTVLFSLKEQQQQFILSSCVNAANDLVPSVRAAACRAIGVIACFPGIIRSAEILCKFIDAVEFNTRDQPVPVRVTASWALANICDSIRHSVSDASLDSKVNFQRVMFLLECSLKLTTDGDKIKSNAVRALGNLSRMIPFANPLEQGKCAVTCPGTSKIDKFSRECTITQRDATCSSDSLGCIHLLERIVQAFLSCITTGNVKVQWNVCHALSNLFLNESLRMQRMDWTSSIYSILLLLLRDSSNYKIRIQAAAALAVPSTVLDYGSSFSDVVQGIQHNLENVMTDQHSTLSFKYRIALEKQVWCLEYPRRSTVQKALEMLAPRQARRLTASMLHVLGLCSSSSHEPLKEFLLKKAFFIECWLKDLCSSLEKKTQQDDEVDFYKNQKRDLVSKAIQSLIEVYDSKNQSSSAQKLQNLLTVCG
ncbi:HEAT repeat-containing protein 6 [Bienertia sinuspersici]